MPKYKVIMSYSDGTKEAEDEVFETELEAQEYGLTCCDDYQTGGEVLHMSNPGDYPLNDDDDVDFEVVEVED